MGSIVETTEITNMMGIHLRPASNIVQIANQYPDCEVELTKDGQTVNGKSIMSVIMLAAEQGSTIKIEVHGDESKGRQLMDDLLELIANKFGEE
ncbi:MAG: HPr family phosphocarrier protein [Candidatus Sumerlaeia bacterium]